MFRPRSITYNQFPGTYAHCTLRQDTGSQPLPSKNVHSRVSRDRQGDRTNPGSLLRYWWRHLQTLPPRDQIFQVAIVQMSNNSPGEMSWCVGGGGILTSTILSAFDRTNSWLHPFNWRRRHECSTDVHLTTIKMYMLEKSVGVSDDQVWKHLWTIRYHGYRFIFSIQMNTPHKSILKNSTSRSNLIPYL